MTQVEKDFHSMQFALYISLAFEILAAIMFLLTTFYVVSDRQKAEESEKQMALTTTRTANTGKCVLYNVYFFSVHTVL